MPSIQQINAGQRPTGMGADSSLLEWARAYAAKGWPVFPLHTPRLDGRCSCGKPQCSSPGKHPRTPNGFKDATTDTQTIEDWWRQWPDANIGIPTGSASGIVVIDLDPRHGGIESWESLVAEHGPVKTLTSITGGGGRHLIFKAPEGAPLKSTAGQMGPGIDTKAEGGYIVAPPSLHASGRRYRWQQETE